MGGRLEVVADGLPLFRGVQVAEDTTLVSLVSRDGLPHPRTVGGQPREKRRGLMQSSRGSSAEPDSWCSLARWVEDGLRRHRPS